MNFDDNPFGQPSVAVDRLIRSVTATDSNNKSKNMLDVDVSGIKRKSSDIINNLGYGKQQQIYPRASLSRQRMWQEMPRPMRRQVRNMMPDSDGDSVPNFFDCQPHNPMRQDNTNLENDTYSKDSQVMPIRKFKVADKPVEVYNDNPIPKKNIINDAYSNIPDDISIPLQFMTRKQYLKKYVNNQERENNTTFSKEQRKQYYKNNKDEYGNIIGRYTTEDNPYYKPAVVVFNDTSNQKNIKGDNFKKLAWHEYGHEFVEDEGVKMPLMQEEMFATSMGNYGINGKKFNEKKVRKQLNKFTNPIANDDVSKNDTKERQIMKGRHWTSSGKLHPWQKNLVSLARQSKDSDEFFQYKDYGRPVHLTRDSKEEFELSQEKGSRDMSSMGSEHEQQGSIMFTNNLGYWDSHYNNYDYNWETGKDEYEHSKEEDLTRPTAAVIDLSNSEKDKDFVNANRGFGDEHYVEDVNKIGIQEVNTIEEERNKQREFDEKFDFQNKKEMDYFYQLANSEEGKRLLENDNVSKNSEDVNELFQRMQSVLDNPDEELNTMRSTDKEKSRQSLQNQEQLKQREFSGLSDSEKENLKQEMSNENRPMNREHKIATAKGQLPEGEYNYRQQLAQEMYGNDYIDLDRKEKSDIKKMRVTREGYYKPLPQDDEYSKNMTLNIGLKGETKESIKNKLEDEGLDYERTVAHGTSKEAAENIRHSGVVEKGTLVHGKGMGGYKDAKNWATNIYGDEGRVIVGEIPDKQKGLKRWKSIGRDEEREGFDDIKKSPYPIKNVRILKPQDDSLIEEDEYSKNSSKPNKLLRERINKLNLQVGDVSEEGGDIHIHKTPMKKQRAHAMRNLQGTLKSHPELISDIEEGTDKRIITGRLSVGTPDALYTYYKDDDDNVKDIIAVDNLSQHDSRENRARLLKHELTHSKQMEGLTFEERQKYKNEQFQKPYKERPMEVEAQHEAFKMTGRTLDPVSNDEYYEKLADYHTNRNSYDDWEREQMEEELEYLSRKNEQQQKESYKKNIRETLNTINDDDSSKNMNIKFWKKDKKPETYNETPEYPEVTGKEFQEEQAQRQVVDTLDPYGESKSYSGKQIGNTMIAVDTVLPTAKVGTIAGLGVRKYVDKVKLEKTDEFDEPYRIPKVSVQMRGGSDRWKPRYAGEQPRVLYKGDDDE